MAKSLGRYRCHEVGIFSLQRKMMVLWNATKESTLSCCSMTNIMWPILSKTLIQQKMMQVSGGLDKCNLEEEKEIFISFPTQFLLN